MIFLGIVKTKGIVINQANSKETDKILTILTPDLGKISVIVKGAKKSSSKVALSELFVFLDLVLYKNTGDIYVLNSAEIIEMFYNLRIDIEKIYYLTYICRLVSDVATENENSFELMQLLLNTIYLFSEGKKDNMFIATVFQIRLLRVLGFNPIIKNCAVCGNEEVSSFSIRDNGLICLACAKQDTGSISLSQSTISALKYILVADSKKVFSFSISDNVLSELRLFIKIYLHEKLEKEYDIDKYLKNYLI